MAANDSTARSPGALDPGPRPANWGLGRLADLLERPFERLTGVGVGHGSRAGQGSLAGPNPYQISRWLFLRALGLIFLIAFLSLWTQVQGLMGPAGILPARNFLDAVLEQVGPRAYRLVPTVLWLGAGRTALHLVCGTGALCSVLLVLDLWPVGMLAVLWGLYLSLVTAGGDFLAFQWDVLLLEAGLLALLLAPRHVLPRRASPCPASGLALFLMWWLLFRLTFESGFVKLSSGDPTWRNLTALDYHFFTQPLPTRTAWYAHQLPEWLKQLSVLGTFVLELAVPPLIFCGRRLRGAAWAGIVLLQLLIGGSGNYTFFNLLTVALSLLLLDDGVWRRVLPARILRLAEVEHAGPRSPRPTGLLTLVAGLGLLILSAATLWTTLATSARLPGLLAAPLELLQPLRSVNQYGLFRVMTTTRAEIVVEGSDDGETWMAYQFKYKPGDVTRAPALVEPHQPRLDWQMWFAALGSFETTSWFQAFLARLLQGSPDVVGLLAVNPFQGHPPRYVRAQLYEYRFTDSRARRETGAWWTRRYLGPYGPVLSRR